MNGTVVSWGGTTTLNINCSEFLNNVVHFILGNEESMLTTYIQGSALQLVHWGICHSQLLKNVCLVHVSPEVVMEFSRGQLPCLQLL